MTTLLWQFLALLGGTLVLFGVLSAAMTVLTRWIGAERLRRWVGGNPVTAPVKGLVFGVLTPFCSWSTIPVLMSLLSSRVRTSAVAAFSSRRRSWTRCSLSGSGGCSGSGSPSGSPCS